MNCQAESRVRTTWPIPRPSIDAASDERIDLGIEWRPYDEELANTITHGAGLVLSVGASAWLMQEVVERGASWQIIGCAIYAVSLVSVYFASTLSHLLMEPRLKRLFRVVDQAVIYLLIVGTFTPCALRYLSHGWWWLLLVLMWMVGLAGFFSKFFLAHRVEAASAASYVLMGWIPVVGVDPIVRQLPLPAVLLIFVGGLFYTIGTVFLTFDRKAKYFHAAWHVFVIAGSACHFLLILWYVAAPAR